VQYTYLSIFIFNLLHYFKYRGDSYVFRSYSAVVLAEHTSRKRASNLLIEEKFISLLTHGMLYHCYHITPITGYVSGSIFTLVYFISFHKKTIICILFVIYNFRSTIKVCLEEIFGCRCHKPIM
jgi:hypothetical protein